MAATCSAAIIGVMGAAVIGTAAHADDTTTPAECVPVADAMYTHTFAKNETNGTVEASVTIKQGTELCNQDAQSFLLVSYYTPSKDFKVPQFAFDHVVGTIEKGTTSISLVVNLPACYTQADLVFGGEEELLDPLDGTKLYGDKKLGTNGSPGKRSSGPNGWYNGWGTEDRRCTQPEAEAVHNCDGSMEIALSNSGKYSTTFRVTYGNENVQKTIEPGEGDKVIAPAGVGEVTVTDGEKFTKKFTWTKPDKCDPQIVVEPDCDEFIVHITNPDGNDPLSAVVTYGTETKNLTVAGGATATASFAAGPETGTVSINQGDPVTVTWEKPDDCPTPTTPPATTPPTTTTPPLPDTGASVGGVIGTGAALLGLGGLLVGAFFVLRRRRATLHG